MASVRNPTHELIGVAVALGASRALEADALHTAALGAGALYGSWLPDVDQLGSRVHRRTRLERRNLVAGLCGLVGRLPLLAFGALARHRGVTHSLLACALVAALALAAAGLAGGAVALPVAGLALGYSAHVAGDACTPSGVHFWAPLSQRPVWLLPRRRRISTGSFAEALVAIAALLSAVGLLIA